MSTPMPRRVDRYEILSPISEGGMAAVYHARFEAPGGASKQVALKLIHPHLSREPEFVRMFLTEMRVAMAMSHRNIVQTFDAGKDGDRYFLVMELMNRGSLSGVLSIPLDIAVLVAMEICAALEYAHTFRGEPVIHRDVSPSNILFSDHGDVKLADFGVAKVAGRLARTMTGMVKGKLSYMAPEQARGEADPRSDLFALGAVLYRIVTGLPLRPNPSLEEARIGVRRIEFPPERAAELPLSFQALVCRCLSRDPEQRPQSAAELRALLARELDEIQRALGTGGDPLARLRGFFAPRAAVVSPPAVSPAEPKAQAHRLAQAVLQGALAIPTHAGQQPGLAEAPTLPNAALAEATTAVSGPLGSDPLDEAATMETPVSRIPEARPSEFDEATTTETSVSPIRERQHQHQRQRRTWLARAALFGALALVGGALGWALWPRPAERGSAAAGTAAGPPADAAPASILSHAAGREPIAAPISERDAGEPEAPEDGARREPDAAATTADKPDGAEPLAGASAPDAAARRPRRGPGGHGLLDLNSSPFAKVHIDGRLVGETPLQGVRLRAGRHVVRLVNRERKLSARVTVQVRAGHTTRRWIRLSAPLSE